MRFGAAMAACLMMYMLATEIPARPEAHDKILGRWEAPDGDLKGAIFEFARDGVVKLTLAVGNQKVKIEGTYKMPTADTLEITFKGPDGKDKIDKAKFRFDKEDLIITDPNGKPVRFSRSK